jgi:hypothetical protein
MVFIQLSCAIAKELIIIAAANSILFIMSF